LMGGLLHLVQRGGAWAGPQPAQVPLRCIKCNSPPINSQCTSQPVAARCSWVLMCHERVNVPSLRWRWLACGRLITRNIVRPTDWTESRKACPYFPAVATRCAVHLEITFSQRP